VVTAKVCVGIVDEFFYKVTYVLSVCQIGCTSCADGTGACQVCKSGFTKDANDATKCNFVAQSTSGGVVCPSGSFANGASCAQCSSSCQSCSGPTAKDCVVCASGSFTLNGTCVSADSNGVCQGTSLIADNNKRECDCTFWVRLSRRCFSCSCFSCSLWCQMHEVHDSELWRWIYGQSETMHRMSSWFFR
jgi:hypothetical protein